jgi:hypothetical protein
MTVNNLNGGNVYLQLFPFEEYVNQMLSNFKVPAMFLTDCMY